MGIVSEISKNVNCKVIQICRGATNPSAPPFVASKLISNANKQLVREFGNIIIVAYADPEWREIGAIYQACNSIYLGTTNPKNQSNYIIHNDFLSGWQVRKKYGSRNMNFLKKIDPKIKKIPLTPKHKYISKP